MTIIRLTVALMLAFCLPKVVFAQSCRVQSMTDEALSAWYNPNPAPTDYMLPLPLGMALVFVPVPLGTTGLYGDEKTTFTMGFSKPRVFETQLEVRVGSSITDNRGQTRLLMGKYEVSKAQYSIVMGGGSLPRGVAVLRERTRDTRVQKTLDEYLDGGACENQITGELHRILAEPLTFLSYRDYVEFLDRYNMFCINRVDCRAALQSLGSNRDIPGFVRLPTEHEWEFVSRGGGDLVAGRLTKPEIQLDVPRLADGTSISTYAHIGNDPARVIPIGSRRALFGFYDLYGNAQELMANAFTAENGFGAVGAYAARGGHFGLDTSELRASRRVELAAFRQDDATKLLDIQYFPRTGIRLAVGFPIAGAAARLGDNSLYFDFENNYVAPDEAGDTAGNTSAEARDLGNVTDRAVDFREELSPDDAEDWFKVTLLDYGRLKMEATGDAGQRFELLDERKTNLGRLRPGRGELRSPNLIPGDYWIRIVTAKAETPRKELRYSAKITRTVVPDTG